MELQTTRDTELIKAMLVEPHCWRRMVNDSAPMREAFDIPERPDIRYVTANEAGNPVALFLLCSRPCPVTAEVHLCMHPAVWGRSRTIFREFLAWTWGHTGLMRLIGPVPSYNRLARKLAESVGFREYHRAYECGIKHNRAFDLIYMELERPHQ